MLGPWASIVREASGGDYDAAARMSRWPLNEVLNAYLRRLREAALQSYRHRCLIWACGLNPWAKKNPDPPPLPEILKDDQ